MNIERPNRKPWGAFPEVAILGDEAAVRGHAEYRAAKAGDIGAAKRLAAAFVGEAALDALRGMIAAGARSGAAVRILPVHAVEAGGINRIPAALAQLLGQKLGLEVETGVVQANVVAHTGSSGWWRLAHPAVFDGEVAPRAPYLLADDLVAQGGTLANLRGHVLARGGAVLGATALTGKAYSATLSVRGETLTALRAKHGPDLENWWRKSFGYGFDELTESEARYLLRAESARAVRDRILEAGPQAKR